MSESESASKSFAAKLCKVAQRVGYVQKDARNSWHKYSYASADAVLSKVRAELAAEGLFISEARSSLAYFGEVGDSVHAVVRKEITIGDSIGNRIVTEAHGGGTDKGDKAVMKAETAALKYAVAAAFLISWGDDPEGDETVDKAVAAKAKPRSRKPDPEEDPRVGELRELALRAMSGEDVISEWEVWVKDHPDLFKGDRVSAPTPQLEVAISQTRKIVHGKQ